MMASNSYDVIVIGAGVEGSATAYYLTSRYTKNVLLLEQFTVGHTRGSSHGGSRITRRAYGKPYYVKMMDESFKLWEEIEERSQTQIYKKTGIIAFGDSKMNSYVHSLSTNNTPHRVLTGKEANDMYPNQLKLPEDYICVTEESGGILKANTAVSVLQALFVENGGQLLDEHKVTRINPTGPIITVETDKGIFRSKKVIITAGAWTNKVLQCTGLQLPLKVIRTEVLYWPVYNERFFASDSFPVFFADFKDIAFYGLPIAEYPGLFKACLHDGPEVDPDCRDMDLSGRGSASQEIVAEFVRKHFKGVHDRPSIVELCMYTQTDNEDPFLDVHPKYSNIIIGAGFSGHGFKLAPVVGKILSDMALEHSSQYDLSPFKINRNIIKSSL